MRDRDTRPTRYERFKSTQPVPYILQGLLPAFREITRRSVLRYSLPVQRLQSMLNQNDFIYMEKLVSDMVAHTTCKL